MPGVPLDALAQVKRGLRSLFSRRKKKNQPTQPEPTPSSNAPTQTTTAAAAAPVEAPATSTRSVTEAEDASKNGASWSKGPRGRQTPAADNFLQDPPNPPPHPAADPTPTTAASLMPDPPPATTLAPTSSDLPTSQLSQRQPHISAPSQIEEAKGIDLNPARDIKVGEGGIKTGSNRVKNGASDFKPKLKPENETGMSATSGPMGDHMAEVWRDSDVGVKEGRPVELGTKEAGVVEGEGDGGKF